MLLLWLCSFNLWRMQSELTWTLVLQLCSRSDQCQQPRTVIWGCCEKQKRERIQHSGLVHLLQQPLLLVRLSSREWERLNWKLFMLTWEKSHIGLIFHHQILFSTVHLKKRLECIWIFFCNKANSNYVLSCHLQTDGVKCTSTQTQTVTCRVGYPALKKAQEVSARGKKS